MKIKKVKEYIWDKGKFSPKHAGFEQALRGPRGLFYLIARKTSQEPGARQMSGSDSVTNTGDSKELLSRGLLT